MHWLKVESHFDSVLVARLKKETSMNYDLECLEDKHKPGCSGGFTVPGAET